MPLYALVSFAFVLAASPALYAQSTSLSQGSHRIEIFVERRDGMVWKQVDPGLVFNQNDLLRFRFQTNFDGYLYVVNHSSSGSDMLLFPREETGRDNRIQAAKSYQVPATKSQFRIAGPAGHEVVYWMLSPVELPGYSSPPASAETRKAPELIPRCDDELFRARGECIDSTAGARGIDAQETLPKGLPRSDDPADLVFMRQQNKSVISSRILHGPIVYEFRIAHK